MENILSDTDVKFSVSRRNFCPWVDGDDPGGVAVHVKQASVGLDRPQHDSAAQYRDSTERLMEAGDEAVQGVEVVDLDGDEQVRVATEDGGAYSCFWPKNEGPSDLGDRCVGIDSEQEHDICGPARCSTGEVGAERQRPGPDQQLRAATSDEFRRVQ